MSSRKPTNLNTDRKIFSYTAKRTKEVNRPTLQVQRGGRKM